MHTIVCALNRNEEVDVCPSKANLSWQNSLLMNDTRIVFPQGGLKIME